MNNEKLVEVKSDDTFNADRVQIGLDSTHNIVDNDYRTNDSPSPTLNIMRLSRRFQVYFNQGNYLRQPMTILFSAKPGDSPPTANNQTNITFLDSNANQYKVLSINWNDNGINYVVGGQSDPVVPTFIPLDTTRFNHITLEYIEENKLCIWVNGKQLQMHRNTSLGDQLISIEMGIKDLGVFSLYGRNLNKQEIVQHFIDNHVLQFTNDEVLLN